MTDRAEMQIPDDIPLDVVAMAKKYSMNDDVLIAVCRAILAERARCARIAEAAMYGSTASHRIKGGKA